MQPKLLTLLVTLGLAAMGAQAAVTDQMIENDAKSTGDVLSWGIGTQGQRYSPLKQHQRLHHQASLVPVWSFSFGGEKQRGQESQPVIHNGKMFVTASYSRIFALDAKTGAKLWKYEHRLPDGIMPCCDVINRGAALYDNLVIFATLDAQLVALNQDTGEVVWKEKIDDFAAGYSASAAPLIARWPAAHRRVRRRIRHRRPRRGAQPQDRRGWSGYAPRSKATWARSTTSRRQCQRQRRLGHHAGKSWPGDLWKTGGAATWLGGTYNSQDGPRVLRHRQPGAVEQPPAQGRQPVQHVHRRRLT